MSKKHSEPISFPIPLSHEVERLFDEIIHRPWGGAREARGWNPSVDLYETADAFVLEADLPGVKASDSSIKATVTSIFTSWSAVPAFLSDK